MSTTYVLFDFMLAQSVLTHVSQRQLDGCLSEARLALKPEGLLAASFSYNGQDTYSGTTRPTQGSLPIP